MSQVTFRGTAIWDDSVWGRGRVFCAVVGGTERWAFEDYPQGDGRQAKDLGREPGTVQLILEYWWTTAERAAVRSGLNSLRGLAGTVVLPDGESFSDCVMTYRDTSRGDPAVEAGTAKRRGLVQLQFERTRADT